MLLQQSRKSVGDPCRLILKPLNLDYDDATVRSVLYEEKSKRLSKRLLLRDFGTRLVLRCFLNFRQTIYCFR